MSPGLRLLYAPAALLAASLFAYALPTRARSAALAVTVVAVGVAGILLASELPLVHGGATVARDAGELVVGTRLAVRADQTGVLLALIALALGSISLVEPLRRPLERCGLLVGLAGVVVTCVGANLVLIAGGVELVGVGGLLLVLGGAEDPDVQRRAKIAFGVAHVAALGLVAAAVQLATAVGTTDLSAIPTGAVTVAIAVPWAAAGAVLLLAAMALVPRASSCSTAWFGATAVPSGLAVLLRMRDASLGAVPAEASSLLTAVGVVGLIVGLVVAAGGQRPPAAVGRGLLVCGGGQTLLAIASPAGGATTAATMLAVGVAVAGATAPAWAGTGVAPARLRALALAGAGGLPCGAGTAAIVLAVGAEIVAGPPSALRGVTAGVAGMCAAVVGAGAAGRALAAGRVRTAARLLASSAGAPGVLVAGAAALLPGLVLAELVERIAPSGGVFQAPDAAGVIGPGAAWPGGYLLAAAAIAVAGGVAAWVIAGGAGSVRVAPPAEGRPATAAALDTRDTAAPSSARAARRPSPGSSPHRVGARLAGVGAIWAAALQPSERSAMADRLLAAGTRLADGIDRWLARQPDLPLIIAISGILVAWFGFIHK